MSILRLCEACGGCGVLMDTVFLHEGFECFDIDQIARCDACELYEGDLEAAQAVAEQQVHGAWLVWAGSLDGGLPASEQPHIYIRASPGDAACLQLGILTRQQSDPDCPSVFAHVKFVEQGEPDGLLRHAMVRRAPSEHLDPGTPLEASELTRRAKEGV